MSKEEIENLEKDLFYLKELHKIYLENWDKFKSMTEEQKQNHVLDMMAEIHRIQAILDEQNNRII